MVASLAPYKAIALELALSLLSVARLLALASVGLLPVGLLIVGPLVITSLALCRIPWWSLHWWSEVSGSPPLSLLLALVLRQLVVSLMLPVR